MKLDLGRAKRKFDPVTIAGASCEYDARKPGTGHRVTLRCIARRYGISVASLWNFRRRLSRRNAELESNAQRAAERIFKEFRLIEQYDEKLGTLGIRDIILNP
jgi:hypothetical protein